MFAKSFNVFIPCVCTMMLLACTTTKPLTAKSQPSDAAAILSGKWTACTPYNGGFMAVNIKSNSNTVQFKFSEIKTFEQHNCTGKVTETITASERKEEGLDHWQFKINRLHGSSNDFVAYATGKVMNGGVLNQDQKELNQNIANSVFRIKADGSSFQLGVMGVNVEFKRVR